VATSVVTGQSWAKAQQASDIGTIRWPSLNVMRTGKAAQAAHLCRGKKRARRKSEDFAGPRGKKKYTRLTQLVTENRYRRPPPPLRGLAAPRDPPLDGARPEPDELEEEPLELVRLCTTDGLIRTGCDLFPLETLALLPADELAPLLLPLNVCHPPAFDCGAAPAEVDPVEVVPSEGLRLIADVLPDDAEEGFTGPVEPALRTAAFDELDGLDAERAVEAGPAAERVIACLC
jgi:hypothetical protein